MPSPRPAVTRSVYNSTRARANPPASGSNCPATKSSSKADVAWAGDFHEGFTIAVPKALELPRTGRGRSSKTAWSSTAAPATAPSSPPPAPASARASRGRRGTSTRPTCSPPPTPKRQAPDISSRATPNRASSRRSHPGPRPRNAGRSPTTRRSRSTRAPPRPTRPPGPGSTSTCRTSSAADNQDSSDTRTARVALPVGMGLNPVRRRRPADLHRRPVRQAEQRARSPARPPRRSGTVTIDTAAAARRLADGNVYVGQQLSRDPASGNEYRIFIDAESGRYGISVRLVGNVSADPQTGQLTTTVADTPQVPFSSFELDFDGGPRAVLSSPPICATQADSSFTPVVGQPGGHALGADRPHQRPRWRRLREDARRTPLRPGFRGEAEGHQGRRLQPADDADRPHRRAAGAEGRRRNPGAGDDRQARRRPLLPGVGPGRGGRERRRRTARQFQLSRRQPRRERRDRRRHRPGAAPHSRRQGLPLRPLSRGPSLPGSRHPRHGRAL